MVSVPLATVRDATAAHFDIYRAELVSVTSTLFAGGDWHWRLLSGAGDILVECAGYRSEADASRAVDVLRSQAWSATR